MIRFVRGNLFDSGADALVNAVNCVGVMGKGIALTFRERFPAMFAAYEQQCANGDVRLGAVTAHQEDGVAIINVPTKDHWRSKSRLADVESGLQALRVHLESSSHASVAVPALGCGLGGLDWSDVRPLIERELGALHLDVMVYEPGDPS